MKIKKVLGTTLAAAALSAATIGFTGGLANAKPRIECDPADGVDCPGVPDDDHPTGPPRDACWPSSCPEAHRRPPAPYGALDRFDQNLSRFDYTLLAGATDAALNARFSEEPAPEDPAWPLPPVYEPEQAGFDFSEISLGDDRWAFASFAKGGRAMQCIGTCTTTPHMFFNPYSGHYRAVMFVTPSVDVEIWEVRHVYDFSAHQVVDVPSKVTEITVHLEVGAFAECVGWESGAGALRALSGPSNLSFIRDTGILEDIADFFVPGLTARVNNQIRNRLLSAFDVGHSSALPMNGSPCATLGVEGDALGGMILWNATPSDRPRAGVLGW